MATTWIWAGAQTDNGATVTAKTTGTSCRLVVSASADLSSPTYSTAVTVDADGYVRLSVTGLNAATLWHYGIEIDSTLDPIRGQFRTLPTDGNGASFSLGFASCWNGTTDHPIGTTIANRDLLTFVHLGDFHYKGGDFTTKAGFRGAYDQALDKTHRLQMHKSLAMAYTWDDHDFGPNNSDSTFPYRDEVASVYRQVSPHYPIAATDNAIFQSFRIGRIPFIVPDLRYHRDPETDPNGPAKTMMGAEQKQWLKGELIAYRDDGAPMIFLCSGSVWSLNYAFGESSPDTWGRFPDERAELGTFIEANNIPPVVILSGDAHQLSWNSGRTLGAGQRPLPEHVSAAMSAPSATRLGPWTVGPHVADFPNEGQYSTLDLTDDGNTVHYTVTGYSVDALGAETIVYQTVDNVLAFPADPPDPGEAGGHSVSTWDGSEWVRHPALTSTGSGFERRNVLTA